MTDRAIQEARETGAHSATEPAEGHAMATLTIADGREHPVKSDQSPEPSPPVTHLQLLAEKVAELAATLEEANRISKDRERIIDTLHQENQRLRLGEVAEALTPILRDLTRLYDDLQQTLQSYIGRVEVPPADVVRDWQFYHDSVADVLYRQGVDRCEPAAGDRFDPKQHLALRTVPTSEPTQDRTIARVVRVGFRKGERAIRPAEVEVYRLIQGEKGP